MNAHPRSLAAFIAAVRTALDLLEESNATNLADDLRSVVRYARDNGIEPKALCKEAKRATIAVRLGRQLVAKRSDLIGLVDRLREEQRAVIARPATTYAELIASPKRARRAA